MKRRKFPKNPTADSTDLYAFVSPDVAGTVTIIANYIPLEAPDGGPNFYEFADDVLYAINIDNNGDGLPNVVYEFTFKTVNQIPTSFLYNDGPITTLTGAGAANWNRQQTYTLTRVHYGPHSWPIPLSRAVLGAGLPVPPCNIGPLSTPNYASLAAQAVVAVSSQGFSAKSFCGQRADGFYVDLGAVFDLGDLRPFEQDHNMFGLAATGLMSAMPGVHSLAASNVHSLALQVPINQLTRDSSTPTNVGHPAAVIGIDHRVPATSGDPGQRLRRRAGYRPLRPGLPAWQPAYQRAAHRDRAEELLEQATSRRRQAVCGVVYRPSPRTIAPWPLPRCIPKLGPL